MAFREPEAEMSLSLLALVCAGLMGSSAVDVAGALAIGAVGYLLFCKWDFERSR